MFDSAAEALVEIFFNGRHADKVIEYNFRHHKKWGKRDRQFFAEMIYECVRWWNTYVFLSDSHEDSPLQTAHKVMMTRLIREQLPLPEWYEELLDVEKIRSQQVAQPELRYALPKWLYDLGKEELGENVWQESLEYLNKPAEVVLRLNRLKTNLSALERRLSQEQIEVERLSLNFFPDALKLKKRANVFRTQAFKDGLFEVQDASSQLVGHFINPQGGERIIDACAGAGGKSLHLASLMGNKGKIISMDVHAWKLQELKLRSRRAGVSIIETRHIESNKILKRLKENAEILLLDVPCTGLGVLRRNPDSKWKLTPEKITELKKLQSEILRDYQKMVKPGGKMIYSTCSILPSENEKQIENFTKDFSNWQVVEMRRILPQDHGFDGFFMAMLHKD